MRLKTEKVGFMGDIEAMSYQIKAPDSQRSFVMYLWWNNSDLNRELANYEMGIHVFGGTSSPGCCNYALRRAAIDNVPNFDTEVAETRPYCIIFMKMTLSNQWNHKKLLFS